MDCFSLLLRRLKNEGYNTDVYHEILNMYEEIYQKNQILEKVNNVLKIKICDMIYTTKTPEFKRSTKEKLENIEESFLKNEIDIFSVDQNGNTILHQAAQLGVCEAMKYLIENFSFDPNKKNKFGLTPLFLAVSNNEVDIVKYLISLKNIDLKLDISDITSPLYVAHLTNNQKMENCLLGTSTNDSVKTESDFSLFDSIKQKNEEDVLFMVESLGFNVNENDKKKKTPLIYAINESNLSMVKFLVEKCKASVNTADEKNVTPLHYAVKKNKLDIVKYLVNECHAPVSAIDSQKQTPLHYAAKIHGSKDIIKCLTKKDKTLVHAEDCNMRTPLHYASMKDNIEVAEYLIDKCHASICPFDSEEKTPENYAEMYGYTTLSKLLKKKLREHKKRGRKSMTADSPIFFKIKNNT